VRGCCLRRDLANLLVEKYDFVQEDADGLANFLLPMLAFDPKIRSTARACADADWAQEIASTLL
jgi:serine/threonine-protein kinase SRPK3